MDNHPIPQDVTHFQFKLIGNLTLKQFGYVAAGGIAAWITMSTGAPIFIKIIISLIFAGGGLVFAFVPIEGRPADLMMTYFFKALFQPNQYLFQKQEGYNELMTAPRITNVPAPTALPQQLSRQQTAQTFMAQQRNVMPSGMPMMQTMQPNFQPQVQASSIVAPAAQVKAIPTAIPLSSVSINPATQTFQQPQTQPIISPLQTAPMAPIPVTSPLDIAPIKPITEPLPTPMPAAKPVIPPPIQTPPPPIAQQQPNPALQEALAQKKQLEEQLAQLQKQLEQKAQLQTPVQTQEPIGQAPVVKPVSPVIKTVPMAQKTSQAPMVSDFPNIIMGVVKDARGNVLPNILIEVKDNDDNPVRAFKTNALGQFASATPLLNGTYTILFEDPAKTHSFDALQIEASGEIMQPVEVISHDQREDLRKELFG